MDTVAAFHCAFDLHRQGDLAAAEAIYRRLLAAAPRLAAIHHLLGTLLHQRGSTAEGIGHVERAIEIDPRDWRYWSDLGCLRESQGEFLSALEAHDHALRQAPRESIVRANRGAVLRKLGRLEAAAEEYECAIRLDPHSSRWRIARGDVAREQGDFEQADRQYEAAVRLDPQSVDARANRAFLRLQRGDFAAGWQDYELRWQTEQGLAPRDYFTCPEWNGEPLTGKTLLVHGEQGIGDEIMFASCFNQLAARAKRVIATCTPRLLPLFRRSFPAIEIEPVERGQEANWVRRRPATDYHIAAGSVPRLLRPSIESFAPARCYLRADPVAVAAWRKRLAALGGTCRIGIAWRGGARIEHRLHRSTELTQWTDLLAQSGVDWIDLQFGDTAEERRKLAAERGIRLHRFGEADPAGSLADHAALVAALDLVIAVDSTTVHLAGALGGEVWTLASRTSGWRWTIGRETSLWYPRMTILRQPANGNWRPLFDELQSRLALWRQTHNLDRSQPCDLAVSSATAAVI